LRAEVVLCCYGDTAHRGVASKQSLVNRSVMQIDFAIKAIYRIFRIFRTPSLVSEKWWWRRCAG
jgi:hypothetical protein